MQEKSEFQYFALSNGIRIIHRYHANNVAHCGIFINTGTTPEMVVAGEASYNYKWAILMLACLGIIGLVFAFLLKREDKTSGYGLELPSNESK